MRCEGHVGGAAVPLCLCSGQGSRPHGGCETPPTPDLARLRGAAARLGGAGWHGAREQCRHILTSSRAAYRPGGSAALPRQLSTTPPLEGWGRRATGHEMAPPAPSPACLRSCCFGAKPALTLTAIPERTSNGRAKGEVPCFTPFCELHTTRDLFKTGDAPYKYFHFTSGDVQIIGTS